MELLELEKVLDVKFPKLFHKIYQSGMMDYLAKDFEQWKMEDPRCFFGNCTGDCEFYLFDELEQECQELYEWFAFHIEVRKEHKQVNPNYRMIPFAHYASADRYCFWYEAGQEEPKIIVYGHDTGDVELWAESFEEFIFIQFVIDIAEGEEELDSAYTRAHVQWLSDAHKKLLQEKPAKEILESLMDPQEIDIYVQIK